MRNYFIFVQIRLAPNQGMHSFYIKNDRCWHLDGVLASMQGGRKFFLYPLDPTNEAPGVYDPNFNYSMEIALIGVPHTIEKRCSSTGIMRPMQWSINFCYMLVTFRIIYILMLYLQ